MLSIAMDLKTLFENPDLFVIEKPVGLSVHNENPTEASVLTLLGGSPFLVHRLDKETSGMLLVAKSKTAAIELAGQFQNHRVKKVYHAVLRGAFTEPHVHWQWALTDKAEGRKNPQGSSSERKVCDTKGRVLKSNAFVSMIEIQIKTGRQHQIRKHAAISGHPVVGDPRYNDPKYNEKIAGRFETKRMFLHASLLEFAWKGKTIALESSLPPEFEKLFST